MKDGQVIHTSAGHLFTRERIGKTISSLDHIAVISLAKNRDYNFTEHKMNYDLIVVSAVKNRINKYFDYLSILITLSEHKIFAYVNKF